MRQRGVFTRLVLVCLAASVGFPLYAGLSLAPALSQLVVGSAQREAERVAQHLAPDFFPASGATAGVVASPALRAGIAERVSALGLERVKAFAADGTVVFSSDASEEGTRNSRPYFREIVARGRAHSAIAPSHGRTLEGRVVTVDVVETYVPVVRDGRFVGAIEVYRDVTSWTRQLRALLMRSSLVVLLMSGGFVVAVAVSSRHALRAVGERDRAAAVLQQERDRLEQSVAERTEELRRGHDDLERLVSERSSALEAANRRLHDLSEHLQDAREKERTRIARELHDELGQSLTAMRMELSLLRRGLPAGLRQCEERAASLGTLVESTAQAVKRISQDLRPAVLDHLGLAAAVDWQAEEFERRTGIPCDVAVARGEVVLDDERATALFRILQEALTNVARHAAATEVSVELRQDGEGLLLRVRDNGHGMQERRSPGRCFGIIGIRERVRAWGGALDISTGGAAGGTTVTVRLPPGREAPP